MEYNFLGLCNRLLMNVKQTSISNFSGITRGDDAYKCQLAVCDTIDDLAHILRIRKRLTTFTITTVAGQRTYSVPKRVTFPFLDLRQKSSPQKITQMQATEFDHFIPDDDSSGNPSQYYLEEYTAVENQPAAAGEVIYIVSSSSSDTSIQVTIQGYDDNDNFVSEEKTLTGATPVNTTNTFKRIESITKPASVGTITIRNSGSTTTYLTLSSKETYYRSVVIGLHPIPSSAITIYGRGYLKIPTLVNEYDVPIGFSEDHLNAISFGSLWRYMKYGQGNNSESMGEAKQDYIDEILKITDMDATDPDLMIRMKSPYEVRGYVSTIKALDRRYP